MLPTSRIFAFILLGLAVAAAMADQPELPGTISSRSFLERVIEYPFAGDEDLRRVNGWSRELLSKAPTDPRARDLFAAVEAFTSTDAARGVRVSVISFADSRDKAVARLRDEIGVPPPAGGAVLRVYGSTREMPAPLAGLFGETTEGVTWLCRLVAIKAESKSAQELEDTISHELAHAYVCSALGINEDKLPKWFHEGVALYLSDARDAYVSQTASGIYRRSWSPEDYEEYRQVFHYLDAVHGRQKVAQFIREAIERQSVDEPLQTVLNNSSYGVLRNRALQWRSKQELTSGLIGLAGILAVIAAVLIRNRWRRRRDFNEAVRALDRAREQVRLAAESAARERERLREVETLEQAAVVRREVAEVAEKAALALVEESRALARIGERIEAHEKLDEALQTAPWSQRVEREVQRARDEMDDIIL